MRNKITDQLRGRCPVKKEDYTPTVCLDPIHFCDRFAQTISGKDITTLSLISRMIKDAVFGTGFIQLKGRDGRHYKLPDRKSVV